LVAELISEYGGKEKLENVEELLQKKE
jgi:hypothetical protein